MLGVKICIHPDKVRPCSKRRMNHFVLTRNSKDSKLNLLSKSHRGMNETNSGLPLNPKHISGISIAWRRRRTNSRRVDRQGPISAGRRLGSKL